MQETESSERNKTMKNNVILIGMPGVGKSTIGVILAKVLNLDFIDSDIVIQQEMGMRLKEIIAQQGIDGFNATENRINSQINANDSVIATGGSAVYGADAMAHFKEIGQVVYLRIAYKDLQERLGDLDERGVVHRPEQTLLDLYNERTALYEQYADIIVDVESFDIHGTVLDLLKELNLKLV